MSTPSSKSRFPKCNSQRDQTYKLRQEEQGNHCFTTRQTKCVTMQWAPWQFRRASACRRARSTCNLLREAMHKRSKECGSCKVFKQSHFNNAPRRPSSRCNGHRSSSGLRRLARGPDQRVTCCVKPEQSHKVSKKRPGRSSKTFLASVRAHWTIAVSYFRRRSARLSSEYRNRTARNSLALKTSHRDGLLGGATTNLPSGCVFCVPRSMVTSKPTRLG